MRYKCSKREEKFRSTPKKDCFVHELIFAILIHPFSARNWCMRAELIQKRTFRDLFYGSIVDQNPNVPDIWFVVVYQFDCRKSIRDGREDNREKLFIKLQGKFLNIVNIFHIRKDHRLPIHWPILNRSDIPPMYCAEKSYFATASKFWYMADEPFLAPYLISIKTSVYCFLFDTMF